MRLRCFVCNFRLNPIESEARCLFLSTASRFWMFIGHCDSRYQSGLLSVTDGSLFFLSSGLWWKFCDRTMISIIRSFRFHFPPTYTLTSRFRWRQSASATEQLVSHEAEAFNVLGRSERVRVCIEPHQPELRRLTGAQPGDSTIDLPSAELKRIIKLLKSSVFMVCGKEQFSCV